MVTMPRRPKVPRPLSEMVGVLVQHLNLLHEYYARAYEQGDERYLGEIAAKLRLLLVESRQNRALLLSLMDHFGSMTKVRMEEPWGEVKLMSLRDYLADLCFAKEVPSGRAIVSNIEFIRLWAEQHGAAHEDWEHDEAFNAVRRSGLIIGGSQAHVLGLRAITRTILSVANSFLQELENQGVIRRKT